MWSIDSQISLEMKKRIRLNTFFIPRKKIAGADASKHEKIESLTS